MHDTVKEYYGQILKTSDDLKTDACCTITDTPTYLKEALSDIHPDVLTRYYGCGLVMPQLLEGARVLDLGCGAGRDVYALARLVGEQGHVVGVDMTPEQLAVARQHQDWHRDKYGYAKSNVTFLEGYIEKLDKLDLEPESFDIIISNCVINLCPDKEAVLQNAHALLKLGGEMYFSDVYADRRLPPRLAAHPVLIGECLGGALYWNDFQNLAKTCNFDDPRLVESHPLSINDEDLLALTGPIRFFSATYRLFKLSDLEPACEDYGQAVIYKGTIPNQPHAFELDGHHLIDTGRMFPVCGNTYKMLKETRFADHFDFFGNLDTHYGIFPDCGDLMPFSEGDDGEAQGQSCC